MDWQLIVASLIVAGAFVKIIVGAVRRLRHRGNSGCSCGCGGCSLYEMCSDKADKEKRG